MLYKFLKINWDKETKKLYMMLEEEKKIE